MSKLNVSNMKLELCCLMKYSVTSIDFSRWKICYFVLFCYVMDLLNGVIYLMLFSVFELALRMTDVWCKIKR